MLAKDELVYIIQSKFDWSNIDSDNPLNNVNIKRQFEMAPGIVYTAVIPECDKTGYSLHTIDELDLLLLQTLKKPLSIVQLFEKLKLSFDEEDLNNSQMEFELLVFGRIKKCLLHKLIKCVVYNNIK